MLWLDLSSLCVSDCPYCIPSLSEMLWLCLEKVFCPHLIVKDLERLGDILSQRHFIPRIFCPRYILSQLFSALRNFVTTSLSYPETFCPAFIFRPQKNPNQLSFAHYSPKEFNRAQYNQAQPRAAQYNPIQPCLTQYSQVQSTTVHNSSVQSTTAKYSAYLNTFGRLRNTFCTHLDFFGTHI